MLRKLNFRIILIVLFGVIGFTAQGQAILGLDQVCIISSYEHQNEWGQILAKKLKKEIGTSFQSQNVEIFYTGISKVDSLQAARNILNPARWREVKPSLLVVIGYEAWMTLKSFNDPQLKSIPIIVCGVKDQEAPNYESYLKNRRATNNLTKIDSLLSGYHAIAITMQDNTEQTVKEITNLLPKTREIILISEQSYTDSYYTKRFEDVIGSSYPSVRFTVQNVNSVTNQALSSLKNKINDENTVLILNNYNAPENPDRSRPEGLSEAPVFLLRDKEISSTSGFIGGTFEPINIYVNRIISGVNDLLANKEHTSLPNDKSFVNTINKSAAEKFGIKLKDLSNQLIVLEPQANKNKYILAVIGFGILPFLFLVTLILLISSLIKERKIAKNLEQYDSSVTQYQTIYRNVPVGIGAFQEDGTYLEWNQEFLKIFKIILPDFKPTNRFNLLSSGIITDEISEAMNQGKIIEKIIAVENNGVSTSARIIFTPIASKAGHGIIVSIFDVTQTLEEKEKRNLFSQAFEKASGDSRLGVAELDFINDKCIASSGWYKGLNVTQNTSLTSCFANLHADDKGKLTTFLNNLATLQVGSVLTIEIRIKQLDSTYNWIRLTSHVKECDPESNQVVCSVILMDIHAQKQKEEQLKEAYTRIVTCNRVKNSFLSSMSNDIRMPLNAIVGFSELIIESTDSAEQKELVKYLNENNEKFLKLVSDIVDMSQIAAGTMKCRMSDVDVNEMMLELLDTARTQLNNPQVTLVFNPTENCIVYSEREKLHQVMSNFIANAIKATTTGTIELGYQLLPKKIQLYVKDTGCGIDSEKRNQLFDRLEKSPSEYSASGTGLLVSSALIKLLKGDIGFDSELGKGSTFWCTIPSEYLGTDTQLGLTGKLESATKLMASNLKTILIAEDNANNFQLLNFILKGKFKILHALNGEKAVEMFNQYNPDIILMDIKMPIMDGYQATAAIRRMSQDVPIIAVTAYAFNNDKEKILDSSFTGFIAKPVREKELMEAINNILNN